MLEDQLRALNEAAKRNPFLRPKLRKRLSMALLSSALRAFERGFRPDAYRRATRALRLAPGDVRAYATLAVVMSGSVGRNVLSLQRRRAVPKPDAAHP